VSGHASSKSYARYDRSKEAKVRAAQHCASESGLTYAQALEEEIWAADNALVDGRPGQNLGQGSSVRGITKVEDPSEDFPSKRMRGSPESPSSDVASLSERIGVSFKELNINLGTEGAECGNPGPASGLSLDRSKVQQDKSIGEPSDLSGWDWMRDFDWEADLKQWEEGKCVQVNPISALFGRLSNCPGLTVNFHGSVNF
jgi:hypothetical protein